MTTSISAVNAGSSAAGEVLGKKSSLSNDTKARLEALGITVTDGMTEADAKAKIAAKEAENEAKQGNQQGNSSESEILSEAKSLASSVGISVSSEATVDEILDDIGSELEVMLEDAEGNPSVLTQLSSYLAQLNSLEDRYDSVQTSQASMYSAMNMISTNNKIALGL